MANAISTSPMSCIKRTSRSTRRGPRRRPRQAWFSRTRARSHRQLSSIGLSFSSSCISQAAPSPYQRLNRVAPYLATLREGSARRIATEKPFADLAGDLAELRKNLLSKSVSLNEAERRQEMAQAKVREAALAGDGRALQAARPASYEITLKNAAALGLPPPIASTTSAARGTPGAGGAPAPGERTKAPSSADDIILNESVQILVDYSKLLDHPAATTGRRPASPTPGEI